MAPFTLAKSILQRTFKSSGKRVFASASKRQERLKIVKSTTTKPGRMVDWVPIESQAPSGKIASPPPNELLPVRQYDEQHPIEPARFEFDDAAIEHGEPGTDMLICRQDARSGEREYLRRDFTRLSAQAQTVLKENPFSGHVFVFRGRRGDRIKMLW